MKIVGYLYALTQSMFGSTFKTIKCIFRLQEVVFAMFDRKSYNPRTLL